MVNIPESITSLSAKQGFYRSADYDQAWMFDNSMGPNPLWLLEWLAREIQLTPEMVVLDMGCGKALTSIFLAKEYGCTVFANDLWIPAEENLGRIKQHNLERRVFPIHAEAHALPYAKEFFDAIVCIDSYQYYGTDDLYLAYFSKLVKPGGQIGIVVPGWTTDFKGKKPFWSEERYPLHEFACFHTAAWWKEHLGQTGLVEVEKCDYLTEGKTIWMDSARAMYETKRILRAEDGSSPEVVKKELDFWKGDIDFLEADKEGLSALIRIIVRRTRVK
jgi:SAM-dependent methyltransferase